MSFEEPKLIVPSLIHGDDYKPDTEGKKKFNFTLTRTGEKKCNIIVGKKRYENHHLVEFLNACAVVYFDPDFCEKAFNRVQINCDWDMTLTSKEYKNVRTYMDLIICDDPWSGNRPKKGFV